MHELATLRTIDELTVPEELSGQFGTNRVAGTKIAATDDLAAVRAWYERFKDSPRTLDAYRREAERLILWCLVDAKKPLSSLTHEDFLRYQEFLTNPKPEALWIGKTKLPRTHNGWKPFYKPLDARSVTHAMGIINNLMSWLVNASYLAANPLSLRRKTKQASQKKRLTRYLDVAQLDTVLSAIDRLPTGSEKEQLIYERTRWVFRLFYLAGLRISEVCSNAMGGFQRIRDSKGVIRWNLIVIGKGNKERAIPVGSALLEALMRYRQSVGLTPLPSPDETTPLVLSSKNRHLLQPIGRQALDKIVKAAFDAAVQMLESSASEEDRNSAMVLRFASAHWIRHSAGSHMADAGTDLRYIRDFLGHENIQTTSIYLHANDEERHEQITQLHQLPKHKPHE